MQKLSGEGGHSLPRPHRSIFTPTKLKLNVTPPEKNPSYGLASYYAMWHCNYFCTGHLSVSVG